MKEATKRLVCTRLLSSIEFFKMSKRIIMQIKSRLYCWGIFFITYCLFGSDLLVRTCDLLNLINNRSFLVSNLTKIFSFSRVHSCNILCSSLGHNWATLKVHYGVMQSEHKKTLFSASISQNFNFFRIFTLSLKLARHIFIFLSWLPFHLDGFLVNFCIRSSRWLLPPKNINLNAACAVRIVFCSRERKTFIPINQALRNKFSVEWPEIFFCVFASSFRCRLYDHHMRC